MTTIIPTSINWNYLGVIFHKIEAPEDDLLAAGIISKDHVPSPGMRSCKTPNENGGVRKCSRLGNGNLRVTVCATKVIDRDAAFKRFLGGILADTRLSLVKGESA